MDPTGAKESQPMSSLLTVKQVAEILQWNHYTVIKKTDKGELPGFKLGREWRFRREDLTAWIETKRRMGKHSGSKP